MIGGITIQQKFTMNMMRKTRGSSPTNGVEGSKMGGGSNMNCWNNAISWQILFFSLMLICGIHLFVSNYQFDTRTLIGDTTDSIERVVAASVVDAHHNENHEPQQQPKHFYGVSFGREYRIANGTLSQRTYKHMLSKLEETKLQAYLSPTPPSPAIVVQDNFGNKSLSQVRFLHIPKTGTTFAATVIHYCCNYLNDIHIDVLTKDPNQKLWGLDPSCRSCMKQPASINGDYWAHFPFLPDIDNGHAVTILRDPLKRLASQISHMRGLMGMMKSFGVSDDRDIEALAKIMTNQFTMSPTTTSTAANSTKNITNSGKASAKAFLTSLGRNTDMFPMSFIDKVNHCYHDIDQKDQEISKIAVTSSNGTVIKNQLQKERTKLMRSCRWSMIALYPGLLGCQTRMIIGRPCFDLQKSLSNEDITLAQERITREYAFVGKLIG